MNERPTLTWSGILLITALMAFACGPNQGLLKPEQDKSSNSARTKTALEEDMDAMRTAGFAFVYVLRRKDGGKINAEDRSVIRLQTVDTNRRVSTDEDRAFIVGTNNQLPPKNLAALYDRFAVENYSPPPVETANVNANSNK